MIKHTSQSNPSAPSWERGAVNVNVSYQGPSFHLDRLWKEMNHKGKGQVWAASSPNHRGGKGEGAEGRGNRNFPSLIPFPASLRLERCLSLAGRNSVLHGVAPENRLVVLERCPCLVYCRQGPETDPFSFRLGFSQPPQEPVLNIAHGALKTAFPGPPPPSSALGGQDWLALHSC